MCIWKLLFECIWKLIFWVHLENSILSAPGNYYFEFIWKLLYYFECIWKILFMCIWKILFWVLLETIILGASRNHTCYSTCIRKLLFWVHLETIILSASEKYFFSYIWKLLFYVHLETTCIWKQLFWVQLETSCICIWIYELGIFTRDACFWLAALCEPVSDWQQGGEHHQAGEPAGLLPRLHRTGQPHTRITVARSHRGFLVNWEKNSAKYQKIFCIVILEFWIWILISSPYWPWKN